MGFEPSNIIDQGYPIGGINLAGQTPIILVNDGPSMGGFIVPYTVPSASFWKLGQAKPNDHFKFKEISVENHKKCDLIKLKFAQRECSLNLKIMSTEVLTSVPGNIWKVLVKVGDQG